MTTESKREIPRATTIESTKRVLANGLINAEVQGDRERALGLLDDLQGVVVSQMRGRYSSKRLELILAGQGLQFTFGREPLLDEWLELKKKRGLLSELTPVTLSPYNPESRFNNLH
jgi:hypothetical protein